MSSRHRRMQTLKYFDKHYRRGQRQSANIGTDKPETTPTSTTEDTQTGYAPYPTGIAEALNNGLGPSSSLNQRSWQEALEIITSQRDQWSDLRWQWVIPTLGRMDGAGVSGVSAQEAPGAGEYLLNQIQGSLSEWHQMRRRMELDRQRYLERQQDLNRERVRMDRVRNDNLLREAMTTPGLPIWQDLESQTYNFTIRGTTHRIPIA